MSKLMVVANDAHRTLASMVLVQAVHDLERNKEDAKLFFFSDSYRAARQLWFDASGVDVRKLYRCVSKIISNSTNLSVEPVRKVTPEKLKQFRRSLGLSQREFATKLGFTQSCISTAESRGTSSQKKSTGVVSAIIRMFGDVFEESTERT